MEQFGLAIIMAGIAVVSVLIIYVAPRWMFAVFGYLIDRKTPQRTAERDSRQHVYEIYVAIHPE